MPFPPTDKTMEGALRDIAERLNLVERRLAIGSTGDGGGGGGGGSTTPYDAMAGIIVPWPSNTVPTGWLRCSGGEVSRSAYPELFAVVGTTYGAGNGSTTFNLPNLVGRAPFGEYAQNPDFTPLGKYGGSAVHTLTVAEMPSHNHSLGIRSMAGGEGGGTNRVAGSDRSATAGDVVDAMGGGQAHNNMPPYTIVLYIISTGSTVGGGGTNTPVLPDPKTAYTTAANESITIGGATTDWADVPGCSVSYTLSSPMWVEVQFSVQFTTTNVATYGMAGVRASGALTLTPETDQATGVAPRWGLTPFSLSTQNVPARGTKMMLLPAGTTTLTMQLRRSTTAADVYATYPTLHTIPQSWVGAPGPNMVTAITGRATTGTAATTPATANTWFTVSNWTAFQGYPGMWSVSAPSKFVLNKPGKWRVHGKIRMNGASSGYGYISIWKNGTAMNETEVLVAYSSGGVYPVVEDIVTSNGTDYIEIWGNNSNANQSVVWQNQLATFEYLGA